MAYLRHDIMQYGAAIWRITMKNK